MCVYLLLLSQITPGTSTTNVNTSCTVTQTVQTVAKTKAEADVFCRPLKLQRSYNLAPRRRLGAQPAADAGSVVVVVVATGPPPPPPSRVSAALPRRLLLVLPAPPGSRGGGVGGGGGGGVPVPPPSLPLSPPLPPPVPVSPASRFQTAQLLLTSVVPASSASAVEVPQSAQAASLAAGLQSSSSVLGQQASEHDVARDLAPGAHDVRLDVVGVHAADDTEVAVLSPFRAPGVGADLNKGGGRERERKQKRWRTIDRTCCTCVSQTGQRGKWELR